MKIFILVTLFVSQLAFAECSVQSASQLANKRIVGPIVNLVKEKSIGKCTVNFDMTVNGKVHHLTETETGLEQEESLCYYARERARNNLLLDLGGEFSTESVTVCKEGVDTIGKLKIGDIILETEVGKSKVEKYFTHQNARCRMFKQVYGENRELKVYYGVICQTDNLGANWIVLDKW